MQSRIIGERVQRTGFVEKSLTNKIKKGGDRIGMFIVLSVEQ